MEIFLEILQKFGLPVAAAAAMGTFIYIILKYILGGVVGSVKSLHGIIMGLDNRVQNVKPDEERIARADGKDDARKD